jgi:hypothetical protein
MTNLLMELTMECFREIPHGAGYCQRNWRLNPRKGEMKCLWVQ